MRTMSCIQLHVAAMIIIQTSMQGQKNEDV